MSNQPIDVQLDLDGNYTEQVTQATSATQGLQTAVAGVVASSAGVSRALDAVSPSKRHIAAWSGFTAAAAYWQTQTADIRADARTTGQHLNALEGDVRSLARTFPVGVNGAVQMVRTVQQLGLSSRAQQPQIRGLSVDMERLAAATGSFGPQMAQGFGQLNREMANLDPSRVARFGDVLTTLHARTGAAAMDIVDFSRQIAPMAQQAGVGETAVLGISAAFVKLGDDGGAAATAVNKILSDLNRSVREGSNDMAAYAQITGMTVRQFRSLYEANPAQALAKVTTAIGQAGPGRGQQMLESLGLEGVRTQRALLSLSQSGGLQQVIAQATSAYGSGSTDRAAESALKGLNNNLDELTSVAGQAADALGAPLLRPLSALTHLATNVMGPVANMLNSGPGQMILSGGIYAALAARVAARGVGPLSLLGMGRQAATSGPVRSMLGTFALGRTGMDLAEAERVRLGRFGVGRFGMDAATAYAQGDPYGRGAMVGVNRFFGNLGAQMGSAYGRVVPYTPGDELTGRGNPLARVARGSFVAGSLGIEGWLRSFRDPFHQAYRDPAERTSLLTPGRMYDESGAIIRGAKGQGMMANFVDNRRTDGLGKAFRQLEVEAGGTWKALGRLGVAVGATARDVSVFGARMAGGGLAAGVRGIAGSALGMVGGVGGLAMLGGFGAYEMYKRAQQRDTASDTSMRNLDIYSVINRYRDQMGLAGNATVTFADAAKAAADKINQSITDRGPATTVRAADVMAAGVNAPGFNPSRYRKGAAAVYYGSDSAIASQIAASNLQGLNPADLQATKIELLKQGMAPGRVESILRQVPTGGTGELTPQMISGLLSGNAGAVRSYGRHGAGAFDAQNYGGRDADKVNRLLVGAIGQQQYQLESRYGGQYARQRTVQTLNQLIKQGGPYRQDLYKQIAQAYGVSAHDFDRSNAAVSVGSVNDLVNLPGFTMGGLHGRAVTRGIDLNATAPRPREQTPADVVALRGAGASDLGFLFDIRHPSAATRRVDAAVTTGADSPAALTKAIISATHAMSEQGRSSADIARSAIHGMSGFGENTPEAAILQGMVGQAQFMQQSQLIGATRATTFNVQNQMGMALAGTMGNTQQAQQLRQQGMQQLQETYQGEVSYYQQRLMAQYQFQVQSERSVEDYQRQTGRAEKDFMLSRRRAYADFNRQITREREDASTQLYNPYERIQAKPVYDAGNLLMNMREQLQAMRQQVRNIRELRKMGLTEQTIRTLGLYDPNNAQQVLQLTMDIRSDRGLVGQFNDDSAQRQRAAGALMSDSPTFKRQRQDFRIQMQRQQEDFARGLARQHEDFNISMTRMAQDLRNQDLEITNNMTTLQHDMQRIMRGQTVDFSNAVHDNLAATLRVVQRYGPQIRHGLRTGNIGGSPNASNADTGVTATGGQRGGGFGNVAVGGTSTGGALGTPGMHQTNDPGGSAGTFYVKPGTGSIYGGSSYDGEVPTAAFQRRHPADPNFNMSIAKAMKPAWARGDQWKAWHDLWTMESGWNQYRHNDSDPNNYGQGAYGIPQAYPGNKMHTAGRDWETNPATQIAWGIHYIATKYGSPLDVARKMGLWSGHYKGYASGGIAMGPQLGMVAEAGHPEAMIPLNERGAKFFAAALRQYMGPSDARLIHTGGMAVATHIDHSQHYYDHSVQFPGARIEVASDDPNEFGRKVAAKQKKDNLTSARGVAWSRS